NAGAGYSSPPSVVFSGGGFTTPALGLALMIQQDLQAQQGLASINVTDGGSGYDAPPTVTISGGGGSGATPIAHLRNRAVVGVTLQSTGSGYPSAPTVSFSGGAPTTNAKATALFGGVPAWKLVLDPRTDLLYLATDRGVFQYTGGTVNAWTPFGKNLPKVAV